MSSFLQSREWAEIQNCDGRETHHLSFGNESLIYFTHNLPLGLGYFYAPRPVIKDTEAFFAAIHKLKKSTSAIFFRVEPEARFRIPSFVETSAGRHDSRFKINQAPNLQPQETTVIDLQRSDHELLGLMHPKTRYNIRLAEKHGAVVEKRVGRDAIDVFYALLSKTAKRDGFHLHKQSHYENLLRSNSHEFSNELFFAVYKGDIAAAAVVNFYDGVATYLHGASNYELRHIMAPHFLHWRIAQEARSRGMSAYDLWGIDAARWSGVTRFKEGFGGSEKKYPPAFDIIFRPFWYGVYRIVRNIL